MYFALNIFPRSETWRKSTRLLCDTYIAPVQARLLSALLPPSGNRNIFLPAHAQNDANASGGACAAGV